MFNITVYSFQKKVNSTKRVTAALAKENTPMECLLKGECGIIAPHIVINYGLVKAPVNFNYAYIKEFKRYYFCNDWIFIDGLWECDLQEDFLATWRDDILNYTAYVMRSASKFNTHIIDTNYVGTSRFNIISNEIDNPYNISANPDYDGGYYVVGIIGNEDLSGYSEGSVVYYVFNSEQMKGLNAVLLKDIDYMNIDWEESKKFITEDILKSLFNPIQYIASCMWFPDFPADRGTTVPTVAFGFWRVQLVCRELKVTEYVDTTVRYIDIPKHPQAASYGDWCNLAPFTTYQLHVSPYGLLDVPADELINSSKVGIEVVEDFVTGNGRVMVASGQRFIQIVNFQLGVPIQVSQLVQSPLGALASGVAYSIGGSANVDRYSDVFPDAPKALTSFGDSLQGFIEKTATAIGDSVTACTSTMQSVGSNGSKAWFATGEIFWRMSGKFITLTDRGDEVQGRPLCEMAKLSTLSGFTLCRAASLSFEGNSVEQQIVNEYLNSGFYIE